MVKKLNAMEAILASAVISFLFVSTYACFAFYSNRQCSNEWTAIQFVLEDVQDSIRKRKSIPESWEDVNGILTRASKADLNIAKQFVEFNFGNACQSREHFVIPKTANGWMDAKIRIARIEWLGDEIAKEIEPICSKLGQSRVGRVTRPNEAPEPKEE